MGDNNSPLFFFRVSQLAHFRFCPKRSHIEIFGHPEWKKYQDGNKPMKRGIELHEEYSAPYKTWDRRLLRYQLETEAGPIFSKQVDDIVIRGVYDDLRVLHNFNTGAKLVSFIELKTTSRIMMRAEVEAAIFQLQLYVWIMRDLIKPPWTLHSRHYLEIIDQHTNRLIRRIMVCEDPDIEEKIQYIVRAFKGLEKIERTDTRRCRFLPAPDKGQVRMV